MPATGSIATALQFPLALILSLIEAPLQKPLQHVLLHAVEVIGLAPTGGVQRIADRQFNVDDFDIECDFAKPVEAAGIGNALGNTNLLQRGIDPSEQLPPALSLGAGMLFDIWGLIVGRRRKLLRRHRGRAD